MPVSKMAGCNTLIRTILNLGKGCQHILVIQSIGFQRVIHIVWVLHHHHGDVMILCICRSQIKAFDIIRAGIILKCSQIF